MKAIKGALIDLSGTLLVENSLTPNAVAALARLKAAGVKTRFVTNTTKESSARLHARLLRLGFSETIPAAEIFSSLSAARNLVQSKGVRRPLLLLSSEAKEEFEEAFPEAVVLPPNGTNNSDIAATYEEMTRACDAVVVGLAPEQFAFEQLTCAARVLMRGNLLIAIHKGIISLLQFTASFLAPDIVSAKARYYQRNDGLALGPGAFVAGLEFATGVSALLVGKPQPSFFRLALEDMGLTSDEVVMIGDDVKDDVGGAIEMGMSGILVKTGKYRDGDEVKHGINPTWIENDFASAVQRILAQAQTLPANS
ncbi:haloacid dehalogenase-like hydrolase domain-containing protein 2-like protein [Zopfochytrium polystomum]|nr:haloacid dehalogenase-like hydrolase domain-containing protein 2-like protein [Zopfochytrium polystomum]